MKHVVFVKPGSGNSLNDQKEAAKQASDSAQPKQAPRIAGRSPYAFVPADADIKVLAWPKL